jgi:hypothetical protein
MKLTKFGRLGSFAASPVFCGRIGAAGWESIVHVADFSPALREAIRLAREAGLTESATELEERAFAIYATSSELLGEVGEAIQEFRGREGRRVPAKVAELLDQCLTEVGKVWPKYRPGLFKALVGRIGQLWPK